MFQFGLVTHSHKMLIIERKCAGNKFLVLDYPCAESVVVVVVVIGEGRGGGLLFIVMYDMTLRMWLVDLHDAIRVAVTAYRTV